MQTFKALINPLSAFGTPPKGDTLFGQLCWAVRNRWGQPRLRDLLTGYTQGRPFAVVSDALPAGHLPRPALPTRLVSAQGDRKALKKRQWMPLTQAHRPAAQWLDHCAAPHALPGGAVQELPQPHNSISRATHTTGGGFDPYSMEQLWYGQTPTDRRQPTPDPLLEVYLVLDETRLSPDEIRTVLEGIGALGFGRDASIGLGRFKVEGWERCDLPHQQGANAWLTLAPSAPQGLGWVEPRCFYHPFVRFGRHGDIGVHLGNPFKTPVLLADTGAVLTPAAYQNQPFTGQGLGGEGSLSKAIAETVHQGYAPVMGIQLPEGGDNK